MEELIAYIREVMHRKNIKGIDIEARSGGEITNSYVSDIINGKTKSISVEKLNALAKGLDVDSFELFQAASGTTITKKDDQWPSYTLLTAIQKIVYSPELTKLIQKLLTMKPAKLKALLKQLEKE
jgi:transcriptional regulator with XRE-family HTH domain